eukprot:scaffold2187_cov127-Skeletonema_menzelii.AAC.1
MEGALSSDRYGGSSSSRGGNSNDYYGSRRGGGGRGGRGRGRGGYNNNRHRHHPYRRDNDHGGGRYGGRHGGGGGRRGGGRHHHNGGNNNNNNRGPRQPANRFTTETKSVDPQYAMMKQLTAMVAKMGDLGGAAEVAAAASSTAMGDDANNNNNNNSGEMMMMRPVVKAIGKNVSDLVEVLCGAQNAQLFLKFGDDDTTAAAAAAANEVEANEGGDNLAAMNLNDNGEAKEEEKVTVINATKQAGTLATLLVSCAYGLPLQTPSYAALTLGVDVKAPKETHAGFAGRCVDLAMRCLGRDLDMALECRVARSVVGGGAKKTKEDDGIITIGEHEKENVRCFAERTGGFGNGNQIDAYYRAKFLLRYLAYLTKIGIVAAEDGGDQSFLGLLQMLAQAATNAAQASANSNEEKKRALGRASRVLASLILSVLPFAMNTNDGEKGLSSDTISDLVDVIETNIVGQASNYSSDYGPGIGPLSILLKGELDDAPLAGEMEEEEEEEDEEEEDDDDGDQPAPCADTLQDLLRTVRKLVSPSSSTRFALMRDSPWLALTMDAQSSDMEEQEKVPMEYSGEQLVLDLIGGEEDRCKSVPYLMSIDNADDSVEIICRSLDGIVFGRLAIFDAPSEGGDDEEEDDDEEDAEETNPNLESYTKSFSLGDRFFLSDAVRDVLMCHRPMVSDAGADRNNAKEVADQIWAISHLFLGAESSDDSSSKGIEFGIIETLISLIVQCTPQGSGTPSSSPLNELVYLSRVLLELTKLKPSLIPQAIVLAVSGMFEDFMPSLTPTARDNLGHWLSFHLTNTDYQWPKSYWEHWAPYAAIDKRNSRGDFVSVALWSMATLSPDGPESVARECLPAGSTLVQSVFLKHKQNNADISSSETDLINRIWDTSEDPDSIRQHIISDELSESYGSMVRSIDDNVDNSMSQPKVWWRTRLVTRALFSPLSRETSRMIALAEKAWKKKASADGDNDMVGEHLAEDDRDETEDILADLPDAIARFKPVLLAAVARDADAYDSEATGKVDDDKLLLAGEVSILSEIGCLVSAWDSTASFSLIECLMKNQIVSSLAVATWALGDNANELSHVSPQWWKVVSLAVNNAVTDALSKLELSGTDLGGGIGMIIDGAGASDGDDSKEADVTRLDEALKAAVPILKYSLERLCHFLSTTNSPRKIPISAVDLVEGVKRLSRAVLFHLNSLALSPSPTLTLSNLQRGLMSMDADGEKLASVCRAVECNGEQEKRLLQHVAFSVEKLF